MVDLWGPGAFGAAAAAATRPPYTPTNGGGDPDTWYQDCTSPSNDDGTEWRSAALNILLEQLRAIVRKSGVTPSNLDDLLLARAIRSQGLNYVATVGGSANALTVTLDPAPWSYAELVGTPLRVLVASRNTGAATLNVNGLGAKQVVDNSSGQDIPSGELVVNAIREFIYDGSVFRLIPRISTLGNVQVFSASGNFTVPPGVTKLKATVIGGGASGGSTGTSAGLAGGGGGAGGVAIKWITGLSPGTVIPVIVGAGGASQVANAGPAGYDGNPGGTSSFGAYCSATGGNGGAAAISGNVGGGLGGVGTGGDINLRGGSGHDGQSNTTASGGNGGDGIFGGAGRASTGRSTVQDGGAPGAGGGSAYGSASTASGAGAAGLVIVEW